VFLADSTNLGHRQPLLKRLRYGFKPFVYFDDQMLPFVDACIGLSRQTEKVFTGRGVPWLWMPGACAPERALKLEKDRASGPVHFGYFGSLAPHTGLPDLMDAFSETDVKGTLHICGHGKQANAIAKRCSADARLKFHGLLPSPDDCLKLASEWDVLVNPRPLIAGNENNFPSKVFDYALSRRAILTTGFAGVSEVLGADAYYLNEANLKESLRHSLTSLSQAPKDELRARGARLQERVISSFSWEEQGSRIAGFIEGISAR
jgi:glycosyltransferase involved in cell wall biosynthesis